MKTTAIATLLALGMLTFAAPLASAALDAGALNRIVDSNVTSPICVLVKIRPFSQTVTVGPVSTTVSSSIWYTLTGCVP